MAREEKAHFGEFLAVLKTYDPDLAAELKAGAEEVREKTGLETVDPPAAGGGWIEEVAAATREAVSSARRFRKHLAVYQAGPGTAAVAVGGAVVPIRELGVKFSIPYRQVEEALRSGGKPYFAEAAAAAAKLAAMEDSAVAEVLLNGGKVLKASSWDARGLPWLRRPRPWRSCTAPMRPSHICCLWAPADMRSSLRLRRGLA